MTGTTTAEETFAGDTEDSCSVTTATSTNPELADPNSGSLGTALISSATTGLGRDDDDEAAPSMLS